MTGAYAEAVQAFRERKDQHFAAGNGPVDPQAFRGLAYYPPDEAWAFHLPLQRHEGVASEVTLDTNTGQVRVMALFGTVTVPLPGGERTLSVFAPPGEAYPARVFLPFRDGTSGVESYGAGRYLDAPLTWPPEGDDLRVDVDFNMAYHPYCAYGDGWTCPLPPRGNWLPDAVRAGERLPDAAHHP